jgi:hypothetical protein
MSVQQAPTNYNKQIDPLNKKQSDPYYTNGKLPNQETNNNNYRPKSAMPLY